MLGHHEPKRDVLISRAELNTHLYAAIVPLGVARGRLTRFRGRSRVVEREAVRHSEADAQRVEAALRRFDIVSMFDPKPAVIAAAHYRRLCALGITVRKTVDMIIGTFCIARGGHALLTADRHVAPMARHLGLTLV